MEVFARERFFKPEELGDIATVGTLTVWRSQNTGPPYHKVGKRILYKGSDLNDWLEANRVDPAS